MKTTRLRVMIVENEPAHAEAIRDALKGSGTVWDIQVTGSLKEFHERVAAGTPDIVLMDLSLPDGHAVDVLTAPPEDGPFPVLIMAELWRRENGGQGDEVRRAGLYSQVARGLGRNTPNIGARPARMDPA